MRGSLVAETPVSRRPAPGSSPEGGETRSRKRTMVVGRCQTYGLLELISERPSGLQMRDFEYISCDVPEGATLRGYRRAKRPRRWWQSPRFHRRRKSPPAPPPRG